jgi:hypothetical protein
LSFLATLKKHHADRKLVRQFNSVDASGPSEESFGKRDQQPGAIAAAAICVHAAAMGQAHQGAESSLDQGMRRGSAQLGDEAHAACIMIVSKPEATVPHVNCLN